MVTALRAGQSRDDAHILVREFDLAMIGDPETWRLYGEATLTALGFFWKSGWAFVLGYFISAMIQAFVPRARLTRYMGDPDFQSVSLATAFGAASSSCSFAALAAARALVSKGAHFVAAVAFMFASTNLVIELGILILIFLGWQFLAAEIIGGLVLIAISSVLIRLTYPQRWLEAARDKVEQEREEDDEGFDWRERIRSREGWRLVGHHFVMEWAMVWDEILVGFTIAGFVAVLVPPAVWAAIFLADRAADLPAWLVTLENAMVAPFVAAATFIGSMGNIPLATVLNENGIVFAGIMGFIYSDLMVPPLVRVNAKYYGWRVALYIAGIMYVSIVATALILNAGFQFFDLVPESSRAISEVTRFELDYTFWLNLAFVGMAAWLIWLDRKHRAAQGIEAGETELGLRRVITLTFVAVLIGGVLAAWWTS
jgi:uncharacterized membrane protein YraQ (UPF0718 family)